jgi:hypothetical protein
MFEFLFDYPLYVAGLAIMGTISVFAVGGLLLVRRYVLPHLRIQTEDSEFSAAIAQGVMVFYGLAVALIAVTVFDDYSETSRTVSAEATSLAALYRDVSGYPEPIRTQLQDELRAYTGQIINEAWPLQRAGQTPTVGVAFMNRFQTILIGFEPATEGQKLLHAEALRAYNSLINFRRMRLDALQTSLPGVMWGVILVGAFISTTACFFFKVDECRLHVILVTLLAVFIGLIIFMILALDRPFRGDLGLGSEPYQLIYGQLMTPR